MTSQYRHRRSSNPSATFTALEPGEIGVNSANRQLVLGDAAGATLGAPLPLLPIRIFDTRAIYAVNDMVVNAGILSRAIAATGPGAFNTAAWENIAGGQSGPFVLRGGDAMSGHLALPLNPAPDQAVRKDYVDTVIAPLADQGDIDAAIQPLATKAYVDTQDVTLVRKAGDYMTGSLTLFGPPTETYHAATKAYVDSKVTPTVVIPPGMIMDFAGPNAPAGWFPCDGWEISRTDYAALFAAIGTTWGAGNGSTTFNIPNLTSRFRRHRDNSSYSGYVGTYQSPVTQSHYHGVNINSGYISSDHRHHTSGTSGGADRSLNHSHGITGGYYAGTSVAMVAAGGSYLVPIGTGAANMVIGIAASNVDHLHGFNAWSGGVDANHQHTVTGNTGGGSTDGNETRPWTATVLTCIKV